MFAFISPSLVGFETGKINIRAVNIAMKMLLLALGEVLLAHWNKR